MIVFLDDCTVMDGLDAARRAESWRDARIAFSVAVAKRYLFRLCGARVVEDAELGAMMAKLDVIQVQMMKMQLAERERKGAA